tara:strand:+ start:2404 stop:2805 length:402 start_codon:yes stop_codon:yes gene_type:complete
MKILLTAVIFSAIIFTIIDILWLSYAVKNFYRPNLGLLLNDKPVIWAAALFYFLYIFGLAILVIEPGLEANKIIDIFWKGALFGIVAYGTYNLTNMATIKNWSVNVVFVDMIWGAFLTGFSVTLGIYITKKLI